jgi:hypothetical protein
MFITSHVGASDIIYFYCMWGIRVHSFFLRKLYFALYLFSLLIFLEQNCTAMSKFFLTLNIFLHHRTHILYYSTFSLLSFSQFFITQRLNAANTWSNNCKSIALNCFRCFCRWSVARYTLLNDDNWTK